MNELTRYTLHSRYQNDELYHHGIIGMHWGIRRYQPYPKSYKGDGKYLGDKKQQKQAYREERAKVKEYNDQLRKDRTDVFEKAKDVTVLGRAIKYADKNADRMMKKFDKVAARTRYGRKDEDMKPYRKAQRNYQAAMMSQERIHKAYETGLKELNEQLDTLKKRYGDENVRDLKYKMTKNNQEVLDERILTNAEIAAYISQAPLNMIAAALGAPVLIWQYPISKEGRGKRTAEASYEFARSRPDLDETAYLRMPGSGK